MARALELKTLVTEWGLDLNAPNTVDNMTLEQYRLFRIAEHADRYITQQRRRQHEHADRPDHFGDPVASRQDAFQ